MRIALNVADLTRHKYIVPILVGPVVPSNTLVRVDPKHIDGMGVLLECDETRARAIAQVLRDHDARLKQYTTRVYFEGPKGGWREAARSERIVSEKTQ